MYLPVLAVLGGKLFVKPSGFHESRRDVIRLSPVIAEIEKQQGHISCDPLKPANGGPAIQAPLHCSLLVRPAQVGFLHRQPSRVLGRPQALSSLFPPTVSLKGFLGRCDESAMAVSGPYCIGRLA